MHDYIVLIRRKPSPGASDALLRELRQVSQARPRPLVFFHGDGVDAVGDSSSGWAQPDPGIDWCVCRTSLERRDPSAELSPSFSVATLVTFYQAVVSARRIDSLGLGGSVCWRRAPNHRDEQGSDRLLLEVGFAPAGPRQRRETLEMALGAAALEFDASVLFHGDGLAHLAGDAARGWAQITDFDLLGTHAEASGHYFAPDIPVQRVDTMRAAELRDRAATILIL